MECINCNKCVLACPQKGALEVKTAGFSVSPLATLVMVVAIFFGSILVAQSTGSFELLPPKLAEGQTIPVSEVKGYFTIEETAKAIGLKLQETYKVLGIPQTVPAATKLKEISKQVPEYDFEAAKEKAAAELEKQTSKQAVESECDTDLKEQNSTKLSPTRPGKEVDVSELRGSMTILEAANSVNMELKEFCQLMKIPEKVPAQTLLKEVGNIVPGYDFHQVKAELSN